VLDTDQTSHHTASPTARVDVDQFGLSRADSSAATDQKVYVIDTSVLLSDPHALRHFAEHEVVLPLVVINELEAKRHHAELGHAARVVLRYLDDLRVRFGRLDQPVPVNELEGSVRVELNHTDPEVLPPGFRLGDNDSRILAVALNYRAEGRQVVLVSKDLPLRVKAASVGLPAEEYKHEQAPDTGWSGMAEIDLAPHEIDGLYADHSLASELASELTDDLPCHTGVIVRGGGSSALTRLHPDGVLRLIKSDRDVFGLHGRSAEQRVALDLLLDPSVGIVSLGGRAGTGKSALALASGLECVMERGAHDRVIVFRPLYAVGGQELGFLPGDAEQKMSPWGQAVYDTLGSIVHKHVLDEIDGRGLLEVLPLTHIRGRSLHNAYVIVDEAQSLERNVLLTVLSRIGQNSKVVLTHDIAQRDNLRVGRHDGVAAVVERLKGNPLFAHVTLTRPERSPIAALVTELLEESGF